MSLFLLSIISLCIAITCGIIGAYLLYKIFTISQGNLNKSMNNTIVMRGVIATLFIIAMQVIIISIYCFGYWKGPSVSLPKDFSPEFGFNVQQQENSVSR